MYKLCFFVPESHLEEVKQALFSQGAGKIGAYDCCSWQVLGSGQYRPLQGSQPFMGETGKINRLSEYKVEMVCDDVLIKQVVKVLLQAHPYQEPAYEMYKVFSMGEIE